MKKSFFNPRDIILNPGPHLVSPLQSKPKKDVKVSLGVEANLLPYISKGRYASAWVELDKYQIRISPVFAKVNISGFSVMKASIGIRCRYMP